MPEFREVCVRVFLIAEGTLYVQKMGVQTSTTPCTVDTDSKAELIVFKYITSISFIWFLNVEYVSCHLVALTSKML